MRFRRRESRVWRVRRFPVDGYRLAGVILLYVGAGLVPALCIIRYGSNMTESLTPWYFVNLPVMDYGMVRDIQNRVVSGKIAGSIEKEVVIWAEHHPVFTLGRHGGKENLMVSEDFLLKQKIPVCASERGGNITYHAPGQLIVYPIVDLQKVGLRVPEYVYHLEQIMIQTGQDFSVQSGRNPAHPGIFTENGKLGSVGIAIRHGISFHGFALNVDIDLEPFQWIHPCGLRDIKITSLYQETVFPLNLKVVRHSAQKHFCSLFGIEAVEVDFSELETI